jgi:glycerol-3-phosphate dehydrogenase
MVLGMAATVAVVGAGSWCTTVAAMLAPRTPTGLRARRPELARAETLEGILKDMHMVAAGVKSARPAPGGRP